MALPEFRLTRTEDDDLRQVQDAVKFVFQSILSKPILDGRLIKSIAIDTATVINHGLGRRILGWFTVMKDTNATIWDLQTDNRTPASTLVLSASTPVNVDLWVF